MKIHCEILLKYESEEEAKNIEKALSIDNEEFIRTYVKGNEVRGEIKGKNILSLLHTLNDFLSCLSVAERIMEGLK
ncbi:MAG: hypothetical protein FE048_02620 [Thermoplasmata archaeon]|nr:MAG: hypothetical protein FE048_02620 [Thermoplasmata archaeon]